MQVKKYNVYKDSEFEWIGQVPNDWGLIRLQFCITEINQKNNPVQSEQVLSLVKDKGVMLYEEKGNVGNVAKEDISEYKLAYPNTLILNSMNILIGSVGISNYFGCVSPVYYVFKENTKSDLRFINYIFNTKEFQKELRRYANGIMEIRLRVSSHDIFKRRIPIPNKQLQIQIADYLDTQCALIDKAIETQNKIIEKLKEYKKSIITEAVTKGLDKNAKMKDSGIEWIGEIPEGWEVRKFKYICDISSGDALTKEDIDDKYMYEVYGGGELIGFANKFNIDNCILVGRVGANCGCVKKIDKKCWATDNALVLQTTYNKSYITYLLIASDLNKLNESNAQPLITATKINNFKISFTVSDLEQEMITNYLNKKCEQIDTTISNKEQIIDKLQNYKKSLIYECVTGKRRIE